jgi:hypothetical protein
MMINQIIREVLLEAKKKDDRLYKLNFENLIDELKQL